MSFSPFWLNAILQPLDPHSATSTPNSARSVVVLSLIHIFLGDYDQERVKFMVTQTVGDEYEEGMEVLRELYAKAIQDQREDCLLYTSMKSVFTPYLRNTLTADWPISCFGNLVTK